ncbi:hypothetical protein FAIPA1_310052 [Frankia sp. AiPs1]|uniref:hypothetical protein n=1 Tax=Frankia sp. AiPa1 TaxID=573492 RepID=UPI00202AFE11|nr:hypothetical protein [Frankia sp. AiPa1]MCL9759214.1 hypothetical protein [Frankia sp. AiPa1]
MSTSVELRFECVGQQRAPIAAALAPGDALLAGRRPDYEQVTDRPQSRPRGTHRTVALTASAASGLSRSHLLLWHTDVGVRVRNVGTPPIRWQGWGQAGRAESVTRHPDGELIERPLVTFWLAHSPVWRVALVNPAGVWPAAVTAGEWRTMPDESRIHVEASQLEAVLAVFAEFFDFPARAEPRIRKSTDLPGRYNTLRHRLERLWQTAVRDGRWQPPADERQTSVTESLLRFLLRTGSVSYADVARAVALGTAGQIALMRPVPLWASDVSSAADRTS